MSDEKTSPPTVDVERDTNEKHVDSKLEKHAHDADDAMKAIDELHGEALEIDEATNKRLLRTIDWHMMPLMCFVYGMNYLDSMALHTCAESKDADGYRNNHVVCEYHGTTA